MRTPLTTISVSSINDFQRCRARWCLRWLENRVPITVPQALTTGTLVHQAFEEHFSFTGKTLPRPPIGDVLSLLLVKLEKTLLTENEQKAYIECLGLVEPLNLWTDQFPITRTLEVEEPFALPLPGTTLTFQGRPDRVVLAYGKVWHMQHKTIGASRDLGLFVSLARRNLHELTYATHLAAKYPDWDYGGTIYNVVRKLKYRSTSKKDDGKILHTPEEMFLQTMIPIDSAEQECAWSDVTVLAKEMEQVAANYFSGWFPPATRGMDAGLYSNSIDPYTAVLSGDADIQDNTLFMGREDKYAPEEVEA